MSQTSISVWFVCRLCRGSFGQVDAFIEHKKQKHFTQFQNTTRIVFEESEHCPPYPVIVTGGHQLEDEVYEPKIKIEANYEDPINPISSEIIDEPNLDLVEPKSELITYERELVQETENHFPGLKLPKQNPFVLIKRLSSKEIQSACVREHHCTSTLLKYEQKSFGNSLEGHNSSEADSCIIDRSELDKFTENQRTTSIEHDTKFECKLCSKKLESAAQLRIHVGICALYHEDRNRFCVSCNRKFFDTQNVKGHRLRFHGTEEEKMSLYKFKCQVCQKKYQREIDLRFHLKSHKEKKQKIKTSNSKLLTCSHSNCGQACPNNSALQRHVAAVHLGVKPFSCHFPNCNKSFSHRGNMERHFLIHTGERPFKCTVDNCNKAFRTSHKRSFHHRLVHC